jgi:hypothetical protein
MNCIDCVKANDGFNSVNTAISFQCADCVNFCIANKPVQRWHRCAIFQERGIHQNNGSTISSANHYAKIALWNATN